ncbi:MULTISPECIES: SRPBCC family protein [Streptomyces]|uniref:SRPBCC family protein n=1 Tax=Streptomyces lycii TaxID=2654337 RepID=A0ABQ7FB51_9ACTN|nr:MULTISPECIES: SRPBCC family protein [Streptomyces]KAF4405485.1 SRPBCC family protein [Streptomyces lycii]PGH47242.1 ATPase [Streptomyces sp. Ru87]
MTGNHTATLTLPADDQILITRDFRAPRRLVYRAWTTPELVKRWWCGERGTLDTAEMDFRVGGAWRYVMTANAGFEVAFHGEYREIVPEERIVWTEVFEGAPGMTAEEAEANAAVNTAVFTEKDGVTSLWMLTEVPDRTVRDAIIESGMEGGMQEQMAALEKLAASLTG